MANPKVQVLLGDSTPSSLEPDVLEAITQLCACAREVATAYVEIQNLTEQMAESTRVVSTILTDLERFRESSGIGLRATANDSKRPELQQHADQAAEAVAKMIDGWRRSYESNQAAEESRISNRMQDLESSMRDAVSEFLLPMRTKARERVLKRKFDGTRYRDAVLAEFVPGLQVALKLTDTEQEQPRRVRSLVGKGSKLQVGTKKALLRRTEEPAHVSLDDLVLLQARVNPESMALEFAKKPAGPVTLKLRLQAHGTGANGTGELADGTGNPLGKEDRPVVDALWKAIGREVERIVASPAKVGALVLDAIEANSPAALVDIVERIIEQYRPVVAKIAEHSSNPEELTLKVEIDGKREESWVRREDLSAHLIGLPRELAERVAVDELRVDAPASPAGLPELGAIAEPDAGFNSSRIELGLTSGAVETEVEMTEDISVGDILSEPLPDIAEESCVEPPKVQSGRRPPAPPRPPPPRPRLPAPAGVQKKKTNAAVED